MSMSSIRISSFEKAFGQEVTTASLIQQPKIFNVFSMHV